MKGRNAALISTVSNTFCDFALDTAVNKYHIYSILLYTTVISTAFQVFYGINNGFVLTLASITYYLKNLKMAFIT